MVQMTDPNDFLRPRRAPPGFLNAPDILQEVVTSLGPVNMTSAPPNSNDWPEIPNPTRYERPVRLPNGSYIWVDPQDFEEWPGAYGYDG